MNANDKKLLGQLTGLTTIAAGVAFVTTVLLRLYSRLSDKIEAMDTADDEAE